MHRFVGRLYGLVLSALLCAPFVAADASKPIVTLPLLQSARGSIQVQISSSNGVPLRVMFDTAASNSILFDHEGTQEVQRELGPEYYVYFPFTDRLLGFQLIDWFTLPLGKHSFTSNNWVTGPWKPTGLFPGRETPNYDVIAGRDVFRAYGVEVDKGRRRVNLYESGHDFAAHYETTLELVDINPLMAVSVMFARADTNEVAEKLMLIDTGFSGVLMFASEEELTLLGADATTPPSETLKTALSIEATLAVGGMRPIAQNIFLVSKGSFQADGILGMSFLNHYRYAFDLSAGKLYLTER